MNKLLHSLVVSLVVLQGFACAGSDPAEQEDAEVIALDDVGSDAASSSESEAESSEPDAPESVEALSPAERDAQLGALERGLARDPDGRLEAVLRERGLDVRALDDLDAEVEGWLE